MEESYIILDGVLTNNKNVISLNNRSFKYGDGFFETIHVCKSKIQFLNFHFERIIDSAQKLKMKLPSHFNEDFLKNDILKLLNKNKFYLGARVRLSIFRKDGGLYTPESNLASYTIEAEKLPIHIYELNKIGLKIGIYDEIKKQISVLSSIKSNNSLIYILASIYKTEKNFDDCLLLNEHNDIIEATSSNLFVVKNNVIYTNSTSSGCVNGVMRNAIIDLAISQKYIVYDDCIFKEADLIEADEIFLTNAISGIKWVMSFKDRRYFNKVSKKLIEELNNQFID
ncbi:MAG: hypothetical protein A2033_15765 [Bacteroidetes bacterium GWA2_31_9]|nr:MAG: hypothetical protein A2033_15765 [Bacteroidetes bacterium GWA2_31_9]